MRIVIDMQGAQTESRFRGIGRYTLSLARAIVRNRGEHEIILALNGLFPHTIEPIRAAFDGLLPQENIRVWHAPGPVRECEPGNEWRREVAERIREAFLASLDPDVVYVSSLFEGYGDDAVTSIGACTFRIPTVVTLYDLIPLLHSGRCLASNRRYSQHYFRKIEYLKQASGLLAISGSSAQEAIDALGFPKKLVENISAACDSMFKRIDIDPQVKNDFLRRLNLSKPFVMYCSGVDYTKNLPRLLGAFSKLPPHVRRAHQLLIAGKIWDGNIRELQAVAASAGLRTDDLVLTGYVTDDELVQLYNLCKLFVIPSLHEGFGLPALEAMNCGAAVIGANTTSLPEVIGHEDALFDPNSEESIAGKIMQALTDDKFRIGLSKHSLIQAKKFSWDESAKRALKFFELFNDVKLPSGNGGTTVVKTCLFQKGRKKILVIKLDHRGDFILAIPAITKLRAKYPYAQIDIVLGSWNEPIAKCLNIFTKIYKFDFFMAKFALAPACSDRNIEAVLGQLDSYDIAIDLRRQGDARFLLAQTTARLKVGYASNNPQIDHALDIVIPAEIDEPFKTKRLNKTSISLQMLKIIEALPAESGDFILLPELQERSSPNNLSIAIFPKAGNSVREWGKENFEVLVDLLCADERVDVVNIYFANREESSDLELKAHKKLFIHTCLEFKELVKSLGRNVVCVANNSFGAHLASYLGMRVIAVYAGQETVAEWAPVFGNCYVVHHPVPCSPCHIATRDDCKHDFMCLSGISPDYVFDLIMKTSKDSKWDMALIHDRMTSGSMAQVYDRNHVVADLLESIAVLKVPNISDKDLREIAVCIEQSIPSQDMAKQLFIDISELVQRDAKSGIQRVVRSLLNELIDNSPQGYRVEPVYATPDNMGYYYARNFMSKNPLYPDGVLQDDPVEPGVGDVFLGLDLCPQIQANHSSYYKRLRNHGVPVYFLVHDLLLALRPDWWSPDKKGQAEIAAYFEKWLEVVAECTGAICVSQCTANDLKAWIEKKGIKRDGIPFKILVSHNGADFVNPASSGGVPSGAESVLNTFKKSPSFLMVGTLEPRKAHTQVLGAFELLWKEGIDTNLVIVGKQGWMVELLVERLRNHPELNKRLFWLEGISDEYLEKVYAASTCLIAASEGEGFGLPLIEAAQHKLPIIARDIPVFHEVAGERAFYFRSNEPVSLAEKIKKWLALFSAGQHPRSDDMPWLTWKESAKILTDKLCAEKRNEVPVTLKI